MRREAAELKKQGFRNILLVAGEHPKFVSNNYLHDCVAALHAEFPNIPIIVYSGMDDPKLKEKALMCGAKSYLVKGKESPYALKFLIENTQAAGN